MRKLVLQSLVLLACVPGAALAQGPPDTRFVEEFTVDELRDLIKAGSTSVIVATAGTEQNGPHMVLGKHRYILEYTTDKIARALGGTLIAPIITYVPEGSWENPQGHMTKPGTISLPNDRFMTLLEHTAKSLKAGGFKEVIFIGDSGGNQDGMQAVVAKLNGEWSGTGVRAHFIGDYYTKSADDARRYVMQTLKVTEDQVGSHAGITDTSQLMFIAPQYVRKAALAPGGGFADSGVSGNPTLATPQIGERILQIKIDNALAQIRTSLRAR
jgi:creatinine amidohydrolase